MNLFCNHKLFKPLFYTTYTEVYIINMKGKVIQFRRGRHTYRRHHFILDFGMKNKEDAGKLEGKEVSWKSPAGKIIKGKIASSHGNKGLVRAIFEIGLPGQSIGTDVEVKD